MPSPRAEAGRPGPPPHAGLPTVRETLAQRGLQLRLLVAGADEDSPIRWVHSSDLPDPTPFLDEGQLLLTTGTQFPAGSGQGAFDDYVRRLIDRGIVGLGFGTEVVRSGTPEELQAACRRHGLTLLEVPYDTPFIAIVRWVADAIAAEARARDDWSLAAQRSVSLGALEDGIAGALAALAAQLDCRVAVLDRDGILDPVLSPSRFTGEESAALSAESGRLLRGGRRAAGRLALGGERADLQTLGQRGRLSGVLAIAGTMVRDAAAAAVITSAVALTEVSLEQSRIRRISVLPVHRELLDLLAAGHADLVERALPGLIDPPLRVLLCRPEPGGDPAWLAETIERAARVQRLRPFLAPHEDGLAVLAPASDYPALAAILRQQPVIIGASEVVEAGDVRRGLDQAGTALRRARRRSAALLEYSDLDDSEYLEVLRGPELAGVAAARLSRLRGDPDGLRLLGYATVWLRHNGQWEPAARELGLHRHVLRSRLTRLETALGIDLDSFADRAQLWTLLTAARLAPLP